MNCSNFGISEQHDFLEQQFKDGTASKNCSYKMIISSVSLSFNAPIT
jgi:hypothetical protein